MIQMFFRSPVRPALALAVLLFGSAAVAQDAAPTTVPVSGRLESLGQDVSGVFGGLFGASERPASTVPLDDRKIQLAQASPSDLILRIDRLENQIRQLTGVIEQLQFRNQQLEGQLKRMQEDTEFRFQELGSKGTSRPTTPRAVPGSSPPPVVAPPTPGRRSDVFDPAQNPAAPGAPQNLGTMTTPGTPGTPPTVAEAPVGVPGGRPAGAPLDLSTLSSQVANDPNLAPGGTPPADATLPPPPPRNTNATGVVATLPPTATPKDEYDLAYGYVLRKDYALAEDAFRTFIKKRPTDRMVPDAYYWLGESLFQRQQYRDAAESFLTVSTKYESAAKAPDALLRLGQSLAALNEKEAACATLGEIMRKYPRASASVKQSVEREQKRVNC